MIWVHLCCSCYSEHVPVPAIQILRVRECIFTEVERKGLGWNQIRRQQKESGPILILYSLHVLKKDGLCNCEAIASLHRFSENVFFSCGHHMVWCLT